MAKKAEFNKDELECPACGWNGRDEENADEQHQTMEWMAVFRPITDVKDGKIFVDYANYHDDADNSKDHRIVCGKCSHEWVESDKYTHESSD